MANRKWWQALWNRQNGVAIAILLLSLAVYAWLTTHSEMNLLTPDGLIHGIRASGRLGVLVYISAIALSVVISPIPSAPLAMAAGAVWGTLAAGVYSVIGGFLGGLVAYFIGRTLGRSAVRALTGKTIYFSRERGEIYLGWLIFITRLLPVLSFDLISYGAGLTGLSLPIYAIATLFGMIPSTFLLTYMGSTLTVGLPLGIALTILFLILLIGLPWGIHRYNWFGMRDVVRIE
ncbi:MAG TPA: TVP38/TMEM64 family protein [Crinalium sp.]